jgi:hypothetical protein
VIRTEYLQNRDQTVVAGPASSVNSVIKLRALEHSFHPMVHFSEQVTAAMIFQMCIGEVLGSVLAWDNGYHYLP